MKAFALQLIMLPQSPNQWLQFIIVGAVVVAAVVAIESARNLNTLQSGTLSIDGSCSALKNTQLA